MKHRLYLGVLLALALLMIECSEKEVETTKVVVKNTMDADRSFETVEIDLHAFELDSLAVDSNRTYAVIDATTSEELISQLVDMNDHGTMDLLLFQPEMKANSKRTFNIVMKEQGAVTDSLPRCFSCFVPERTDDYAWENNRVAFRT